VLCLDTLDITAVTEARQAVSAAEGYLKQRIAVQR
jgi:hypothetical protein